MKNSFLVIVLLALSNISNAQQPSIFAGEGISVSDKYPTKLIGETESEYIALGYKIEVSLADYFISRMNKSNDLRLMFIDKTTLKLVKEMKFPALSGEDAERAKDSKIIHLKLSGDTLGVYTYIKDNKNKSIKVHYWQFDLTQLDASSSTVEMVGQFELNGDLYMREGDFYVKEFDDLNRIMIVNCRFTRITTETKTQFLVLDKKNKLIKADMLLTRELRRRVSELSDYTIDQDDNVYLVHKISKVKSGFSFRQDWQLEKNFRLSVKLKSGRSVKSSIVTLSEGKPVNAGLVVNKEGDVFVLGNYSGLRKSKSHKTYFFGGSYISKVTKKNASAVQLAIKELNGNQTSLLYVESNKKQSPYRYHREMIAMRLNKLFTHSSGGITVVSESLYFTEGSSSNTLYANSFIVTNYTSEGAIAWQKVVPRSAISKGGDYIYPIIQYNKGLTYIILNDNAKNIFATNNMALDVDIVKPKKKWFKRTVFAEDNTEPVNLPPSNSEEFQQLHTFFPTRRSSTRVRVTTIDDEGNWMINWPSTEMEIGKKNVVLSSNFQYLDKEGNIITLFYDDFHAMYLKKSAFARVTLP
jgi:hypothetical protein